MKITKKGNVKMKKRVTAGCNYRISPSQGFDIPAGTIKIVTTGVREFLVAMGYGLDYDFESFDPEPTDIWVVYDYNTPIDTDAYGDGKGNILPLELFVGHTSWA